MSYLEKRKYVDRIKARSDNVGQGPKPEALRPVGAEISATLST